MGTEPRDMRTFWDARAREDAFFFVDDRLEYGSPDVEHFWTQGERDLDVLLATVGAEVRGGDELVDVGCGVGRLTRTLVGRGARVRAIDVSPQMLKRARELNAHLDGAEWLLGDGRTLAGIADASADGVVSHVVFQHIPDPQVTMSYIRDMGRVLRPGGWAAFQVSNDPDVHRRRSGPLRRLRALLGRVPRGQDSPEWLGSAVDLDDLRANAAAGGLAVERIVNAGTQFCFVLLRRPGAAAS